ncbi:uncharacterized protein KGF55_003384 [Candida pseudojiufengensis]|uniref:uncharacterized protein n=1 Tax=Candida pseudojiufengensis TaxID=497109 RepID=UPI00222426E4|nr:uncharacterized protein KGF55_003384 [Candida pseudojiufengensis]KAI5962308.1 hypothetical protein KGF55_003384 [Candida pseudojiufengensis]
MNVTSNAYYTSQYLNERQQNQYRMPTPHDYHSQFQPRLQKPYNPKQKPVMNNIRPKQQPISITTSPNSPSSSQPEIEFEIDSDDQLEEELTPAQLNYLTQNHMPTTIKTKPPPPPQPLIKKSNKNNNYYLKQKKNYDLADNSMKPKLYTHRTFREVFQDKFENLDKYNPMDSVFENSKNFNTPPNQENGEITPTTEKSSASKFFRNVKFIKDDYNDYNYYDHRIKKKDPVKEIFVENGSDDDEEENSETGEKVKKNRKFKSLLKKRIRQAKKDLGKDFDHHVDNSKKIPIEESTPEEINESTELVPVSKGYDLKSYVNPYMNYVWSWVDYYKQGKSAPTEQTTSKVLVESPQPLVKPKKFKKFTQNSKTLFTSWNEPANKMFNQKQLRNPPTIRQSSNDTLTEEYPKEFIIEYDSSDESSLPNSNGSINEELYYNPETKQLESQPPTSSSSMISLKQKSPIPLVNNSIEIVSSLISLIKKIQVIKLIFQPIDIIGEFFPNLQTIVIIIELLLFIWILFELSRLIDALCMMVKAFCAPMIAVGRFMNKIM